MLYLPESDEFTAVMVKLANLPEANFRMQWSSDVISLSFFSQVTSGKGSPEMLQVRLRAWWEDNTHTQTHTLNYTVITMSLLVITTLLYPPLLSTSICLMDCGGLDQTIYTLCHTHVMCYNSVLVKWHLLFCPSWRGILLCCSSEGFLPFFPMKGFFSISLEVFLIQCEVKGQGCRMCTDCKALCGIFVICDIGLYKIYRI